MPLGSVKVSGTEPTPEPSGRRFGAPARFQLAPLTPAAAKGTLLTTAAVPSPKSRACVYVLPVEMPESASVLIGTRATPAAMLPRVTLPDPDKLLNVAEKPLTFTSAPELTTTIPLPGPLGMAVAAPRVRVPLLTAV